MVIKHRRVKGMKVLLRQITRKMTPFSFLGFLKLSPSPSLLLNMWISERYKFGRGTVFYRSACCTTTSWPLSVRKGEFIFQLPTSLGNSEGTEDKICPDLLFKCFIKRSGLKPSSVMSHQPSCCASFTPC